jgi:hypothetical protein
VTHRNNKSAEAAEDFFILFLRVAKLAAMIAIIDAAEAKVFDIAQLVKRAGQNAENHRQKRWVSLTLNPSYVGLRGTLASLSYTSSSTSGFN